MDSLRYLAVKLLNRADSGIPDVELTNTVVGSVYAAILGIAGVVSVIFIIIGGYKYVISQGNPGDVEKAKGTIIYAIVGLVITMMAFAIVQLVAGEAFR